jgi:hypothetical protein
MENIEEKLFDYLENKLSEADRKQVEAYLAVDKGLTKQVESLRNTDKLMKEHSIIQPNEVLFTDRVMERIALRNSRVKSGNRLLWMALGIFAAIFAGVAALLPLFQTEVQPPVTQEKYLPELPAFDFTSLIETIDNPALIQLVVVVNAIAILLVADRLLSKKFRPNLPALF